MYDSWTDEVTAYRETELAHEQFERSAEDISDYERASDNYQKGLDADGQPLRHPRLGEVEHLEGFDRYTVTVDAECEGDVLAVVKKLNNMVKRHGGEVRVTAADRISVPHSWRKVRDRDTGRKVPLMVDQIVMTIEAPAVAGERAKLVGSFELAEDNVSIYHNTVPGFSGADMEPFAGRWQECDHCGKRRARHASFVCEQADGTRVLIGRQCSMAYLGLSPSDLLARASIARELDGEGGDEDGMSFGRSLGMHVETVMLRAYRVAKHFGGYSRHIREDFYQHMDALAGRKDERGDYTYANLRRMYAEKPPIEPMDLEAFADWLWERRNDEFVSKLNIIFSCEYVKPKRFALLVAGVGSYIGRLIRTADERAADAAKKAAMPAPKHVDAEVGKRFDAEGVVLRTAPFSNDFGGGVVIAIRCDDGSNLLHWYSACRNPPSKDDRVKLRATVKKHGVDQRSGEPQTVITRAKYEVVKD